MLKKILDKPHLFFFGLVPIFIIIGFIKKTSYVNISVSYIYLDLKLILICNITALFFLLVGFNYYSLFWTQKKPKKSLTLLHIALQTIALIPFLLLIFLLDTDGNVTNAFEHSTIVLIIAFMVFLTSIFVHLINFFTSFFLKTE